MKIAITAYGESLADAVDSRFGRASKFMVYDLDKDTFEIVNNSQNLNAPQGAGIQAAQNVADLGVEAVITGHCGPKAFSVLKAAGIIVYNTEAKTIQEAIQLFKEGKLTNTGSPDVDAHWV